MHLINIIICLRKIYIYIMIFYSNKFLHFKVLHELIIIHIIHSKPPKKKKKIFIFFTQIIIYFFNLITKIKYSIKKLFNKKIK
jgi:hypothetical protein